MFVLCTHLGARQSQFSSAGIAAPTLTVAAADLAFLDKFQQMHIMMTAGMLFGILPMDVHLLKTGISHSLKVSFEFI